MNTLTPAEKVLPLEELSDVLRSAKASGKKIVLCHGVFDLLHVGHIRHFKEARSLGDILVVTITEDRHVNKGPHRPAFSEALRAEALASLEMVDYVAINRSATAITAIELVRPDVYVKGKDYKKLDDDITGGILLEAQAVTAVGGRVAYTEDLTFSSSNLLNRYVSTFEPPVESYLKRFREKFTGKQITDCLDSLRELKVTVVGEAILDEYVYCDQMGKSAKEPILAMRHVSTELFAGGSLAVANHAANFCREVDLITYIGDHDTHEAFIGSRLNENVSAHFITKKDSPTIVKRRYVERYLLSKLFEIYEFNDELLAEDESAELMRRMAASFEDANAVIVADFGHGLMTPEAMEFVASEAPFLALNTQINAANIGFHAISQYPRSDFVCIHDGEVRLDARSRRGDLSKLVAALAAKLSCKNILVTRGKLGCSFYDEGREYSSPAFATTIVDRIGSGDAVLALTSLCVAVGCNPEIVSFLANVIGAQKVRIMGNRSAIDRVATLKFIDSLLK